MKMSKPIHILAAGLLALAGANPSHADENLFGYVKGAEPLPKGAQELYQWVTYRADKGAGHYEAVDWKTEFEYGVSDRFAALLALKALSIDTEDLLVDGYVPGDKNIGFEFSGFELGAKYSFLQPAKHPIGLAMYWSFDYDMLDPHSGQDKDTLSAEMQLLAQKYFLDGQLIWVANAGYEATYAKRAEIANLPPGFDWPTDPEMELELKLGTGLSYRFVNNWYLGAEALYETEFETEVGQERWTWFAGPSLHYGGKRWWATLTYFYQLAGGGEQHPAQDDFDLHLIEKTKFEIRFKVGFNF
jgi:hypothetical protein